MKQVLIFVVILFFIAVAFFAFQKNQSSKTTPSNAPSVTSSQVTTDRSEIKQVLEAQVPKRGGVKKFEILELTIKGVFAKAVLKPLDVVTDNALVYLKKENGTWTIIWGPGTGVNPSDPELKDLPKEL